VTRVYFEEKELDERLCICQALENGVHEARVAEVLETSQTASLLCVLVADFGERLLHHLVRIVCLLELFRQSALHLDTFSLDVGFRVESVWNLGFPLQGNLPLENKSFSICDIDVLYELVRM